MKYLVKELLRHRWRTIAGISGYIIATHGNILEMMADRVFVIENGRLKDSKSSATA